MSTNRGRLLPTRALRFCRLSSRQGCLTSIQDSRDSVRGTTTRWWEGGREKILSWLGIQERMHTPMRRVIRSTRLTRAVPTAEPFAPIVVRQSEWPALPLPSLDRPVSGSSWGANMGATNSAPSARHGKRGVSRRRRAQKTTMTTAGTTMTMMMMSTMSHQDGPNDGA